MFVVFPFAAFDISPPDKYDFLEVFAANVVGMVERTAGFSLVGPRPPSKI